MFKSFSNVHFFVSSAKCFFVVLTPIYILKFFWSELWTRTIKVEYGSDLQDNGSEFELINLLNLRGILDRGV